MFSGLGDGSGSEEATTSLESSPLLEDLFLTGSLHKDYKGNV